MKTINTSQTLALIFISALIAQNAYSGASTTSCRRKSTNLAIKATAPNERKSADQPTAVVPPKSVGERKEVLAAVGATPAACVAPTPKIEPKSHPDFPKELVEELQFARRLVEPDAVLLAFKVIAKTTKYREKKSPEEPDVILWNRGDALMLKMMSTNCEHTVLDELTFLSSLPDAPGIAREVHTGLLPDGRQYAVFPYNKMGNLSEFIKRRIKASNPVTEKTALSITLSIAKTLAHLHSKEIVHRDIRPENLLPFLDPSDGELKAKLINFDYASYCDEKKWDGWFGSTSEWMSPEYSNLIDKAEKQLTDVDPKKSDVYALGRVLYWLIKGKRVSKATRDLMYEMLQYSWRTRLTANQVVDKINSFASLGDRALIELANIYLPAELEARFTPLRTLGGSPSVFEVIAKSARQEEPGKILWNRYDRLILKIANPPAFEFEVLQKLRDVPGIIHPIDSGTLEDTKQYAIFSFVDGGDLFNQIEKQRDEKKAIPERRALQFILQGAETLHELHERKIVHRDIKPENFLLDADLSDGAAKVLLTDFEHASYISEEEWRGWINGSEPYMSPEHFRLHREQRKTLGIFDPKKSDIYGLGVTLFTMIYGHLFFEPNDDKREDKYNRPWSYIQFCSRNKTVSTDTQILMHDMLQTDWKNRLTAAQVIERIKANPAYLTPTP
jgi:serine/threonine protein kinase